MCLSAKSKSSEASQLWAVNLLKAAFCKLFPRAASSTQPGEWRSISVGRLKCVSVNVFLKTYGSIKTRSFISLPWFASSSFLRWLIFSAVLFFWDRWCLQVILLQISLTPSFVLCAIKISLLWWPHTLLQCVMTSGSSLVPRQSSRLHIFLLPFPFYSS